MRRQEIAMPDNSDISYEIDVVADRIRALTDLFYYTKGADAKIRGKVLDIADKVMETIKPAAPKAAMLPFVKGQTTGGSTSDS
jgi:hypothetical protein